MTYPNLREIAPAFIDALPPMALVEYHNSLHETWAVRGGSGFGEGGDAERVHAWMVEAMLRNGIVHTFINDLDGGTPTDDDVTKSGWSDETLSYDWFSEHALSWQTAVDALSDHPEAFDMAKGSPKKHWQAYWTRKALLGEEVPTGLPDWAEPLAEIEGVTLRKWQLGWAEAALKMEARLHTDSSVQRSDVVKMMAAFGVNPDTHGLRAGLKAWTDGEDAGSDLNCEILKRQGDQQIVTGPVLIPETVDAQGDIISAKAIEQCAFDFVRKYNRATKLGVQHELFNVPLDLVESWILKEDWTVGGRTMRKGTWMMTVHVLDAETWAKIRKGAITGFSIAGKGWGMRL